MCRVGPQTVLEEYLSEASAGLKLPLGGEIVIERGAGLVTFITERPMGVAELIHPFLASPAAVIGHWLGRESFHAGAFLFESGAWGVVADRGGGKSSTLAWLALQGVPVVCDDMLVVEDGRIFAGPRSIDLRAEAAEMLGVGEPLGMLGSRERWRYTLDEVPASMPLSGWIHLRWGDKIELAPVGGAKRLAQLAPHRGVRRAPTNPRLLLDLAALPAWTLTRPVGWESLPDSLETLLDVIGR